MSTVWNVGTTFIIELPLEITDQKCHEQTDSSLKTDLNGKKILLAEDNELNVEIATVQLEELGMEITRAVDGKDAVEIFQHNPKGTFNVILMDIMMPNMNGYDATNHPRITITSHGTMYANSEDFQVLAITTMVSSFVAEWYGEVRSGIMNEG